MISAALLFARFTGLLKRIPWWAYLVAALLAVWYIDRTRYGNMREYEARAEMRLKVDAAITAHESTIAAYTAAQAEAARLQDAKIAAEIARQERITDAVRQDYSRRLADSRANAGRLLAQARRAGAASAAGRMPVPQASNPTERIDGVADCNSVFTGYVAGKLARLEDRIYCGEQAEKEAISHDALIVWLKSQLDESTARD